MIYKLFCIYVYLFYLNEQLVCQTGKEVILFRSLISMLY